MDDAAEDEVKDQEEAEAKDDPRAAVGDARQDDGHDDAGGVSDEDAEGMAMVGDEEDDLLADN